MAAAPGAAAQPQPPSGSAVVTIAQVHIPAAAAEPLDRARSSQAAQGHKPRVSFQAAETLV